MQQTFVSICIPSYNRPKELLRLLNSIDAKSNNIEVVIGEDCSPLQPEIREVVRKYTKLSMYQVRYIENEKNYGYDKNIRRLANCCEGKWIIFMGDDDTFVPGALDLYISFLEAHSEVGYVLRRYRANYADGSMEEYRYSKQNMFFLPGERSYVELFRRSVFISGFTFRKEFFADYGCGDYDGTLLFQLYIQAQICLKHPSAYCDIEITESWEGGVPYFGSSESESKLYTPGTCSIDNSISFISQVIYMADSIDKKNGLHCKNKILKSYSKYSYGYLLEQRENGVAVYRRYAKQLKRMGFGGSIYFYIFYYLLLLFGKNKTRKIVCFVKKLLGRTPRL